MSNCEWTPPEGDYYLVPVEDNSMREANIWKGDRLLVRKQDAVENGEIAVVIANGRPLVRRLYTDAGTVTLVPANPACEPQAYREKNVRVVGVVVQGYRDVR
ncbi:MAG: LexA family protein [Desulfotomaculales bacterium]